MWKIWKKLNQNIWKNVLNVVTYSISLNMESDFSLFETYRLGNRDWEYFWSNGNQDLRPLPMKFCHLARVNWDTFVTETDGWRPAWLLLFHGVNTPTTANLISFYQKCSECLTVTFIYLLWTNCRILLVSNHIYWKLIGTNTPGLWK